MAPYAIDTNAVTVTTAAELIKAIGAGGAIRTVYLAAPSFDLTGETSVRIRCSLISLTRSSILFPDDAPPVFRTNIFPFEGQTFEGVDFMNPLSFPVMIPSSTKVTTFVRRGCFPNLILAAASGLLPLDSNTDAVVSDVTMTAGLVTTTDLCKIRRSQLTQSSTSQTFSPATSMWLIVSGNPTADQSLYMSGFSMHTVDTSPPTRPLLGITVGPVAVPELVNRAEIFDLNTLANASNANIFGTQESVFLANNTMTSPVAPTGADFNIQADEVAGTPTDVFSDCFGLVSISSGTTALLTTGGASTITLGTNQYVAAERGAATISAYTIGV